VVSQHPPSSRKKLADTQDAGVLVDVHAADVSPRQLVSLVVLPGPKIGCCQTKGGRLDHVLGHDGR